MMRRLPLGVLFVATVGVTAPNETELPESLSAARKLSDELRYEEAVVEFQRYLGLPARPVVERSRALLELGFIHRVLGDEVSAERRGIEALELDPALTLPAGTPPKEAQFLEDVRQRLASRPRLSLPPRASADPPQRIRATLTDPKAKVKSVLLRHALSPTGPYYSVRMECATGNCAADIPPPQGVESYTAWYFVEANDAQGNTVARAANPETPLQVAVFQKASWYKSPWVWVGGAAVVVGLAAAFYASSGH